MENVVLTSACHINPESGIPLNAQINSPPVTEPEPTPEPIQTTELPVENETPSESIPIEQTEVDGNCQVHMDVNYQAHDVALASTKANGHEHTNGLKAERHQKLDMNDGFENLDKVKPCWLMLNKLFLAMAIVCFALFLGAMALFVSNRGLATPNRGKDLFLTHSISADGFLNDREFNLTNQDTDGMIIVLSRRGASIKDILIPYTDSNQQTQYRSIVLKGDLFGTVRFGFDEETDASNMNNQLPADYPLLDFHRSEWSVSRELHTPNSVRFINGMVEVLYEFSPKRNELMMQTIVSPETNEHIIADPTTNVYFNLRGTGDLSTHHLNITSFIAYNIQTGEVDRKQQISPDQTISQLTDLTSYFYKFDKAGIGKQFIGILNEDETKTKVSLFTDHLGMTIDPLGTVTGNENLTISDMNGIRLSPRQSPIYQAKEAKSIYGPTQIISPSQAIHTIWWKFEY